MNPKFLQKLTIVLFFSVVSSCLFGQGATCFQMEGFCTDSGIAFPASINTLAEPGNTYGCLVTQPNPAWYYFEISAGGDLIVELTNSQNADVDFIVYGPFADLATAQSNCGSLSSGVDAFGCDFFTGMCPNGVPCDIFNPCVTGQGVDCSYDPQSIEVVDIPATQVGEVYILMITNFSNLPTNIFANQIGGTAATDCSVVTICPTVGFYDVTANSPLDCNASPVALQAFDQSDAGGFITPGFDFAIDTDGNSTTENSLEFFDGPNGTGNSLGIFPVGTVPSNTNWSIFGEYYLSGNVYSAVWCDLGSSGTFNYSVTDHASGSVLSSGTALGSNGCTTINFGPLTGTATFSGPGVTNQNNGVGFFSPSAAGDGIHTITYSWDDGQGCAGSSSQMIEVTGCQVCTADAGTFTTPNGLVICFGDDYVMTSNGDYAGSFETGDNMDIPLPDGALGGPLDGIPDADGDGVNGVIYALYTNPPSPYILSDPNFFQTIGSEPTGLFGNGTFTNNIGGNTQYWATTSYAFDEDLAASSTAIVGFDIGNDGSIDCFHTNQADAVLVTFLDEVTAPFSQSCNGTGDAVNITFILNGGLPGFDGSMFTITGDGPGGTLPDGGVYTIANHPASAPFSITVNDNNGCQQIFSGTAINLPNAAVSATDVTCNGDADGTIAVLPSDGTGPYTIQWSSGQTALSVSNLSGGNYSVTVTDVNGCNVTGITTVNEPGALTVIALESDITCNGDDDGSIIAMPSGGTAPFTYIWSNSSETTQSVTGLSPGPFSLTVNDASGCMATTSATIDEPDALSAIFSSAILPMCNGDCNGEINLLATGGTLPFTFSWSNGATTLDISALCAGFYEVTVTDGNGCTANASGTLGNPPVLQIPFSLIQDASCNGSLDGNLSVAPSGGTPAYTYAWSHDGLLNAPDANNLNPGNYVVTVTDQNGCTATNSAVIGANVVIDPAGVSADPVCFGDNSGSITLTPSGSPNVPYSFSWSSNAATGNSNTAINLGAATYSVTVTDASGCFVTAEFTLNEPPGLNISIVADNNVSCNGFSDGAATSTAAGGIAPYTFLWSTSAAVQTSATASGLPSGLHELTVSDANGCSRTTSIVITEPALIQLALNIISGVSCNGLSDGNAQATVTGGTPGYTFAWDNGETTDSAAMLDAGIHSLTLADANGCTATGGVTISEPPLLQATLTETDPSCNGFSDGSAQANPTGGMAGYTFAWSNGQTGDTASNLSAGTYNVTISDANNCSVIESIDLTDPAQITAMVNTQPTSCTNTCDGQATVLASGGSGNYMFSWGNGEVGPNAIFLCPGTHNVTITDQDGCSIIEIVQINSPAPIIPGLISSTPALCSGGNDGSASIAPSGGTSPYTFTWTDAVGMVLLNETGVNSTLSGLTSGVYFVQVNDASGCQLSPISITVNEPSTPISLSTSGVGPTCNGGDDGYVSVDPLGGTPSYNYQWDNAAGAQSTQTAFNLADGTYFVTVTDANGCTETISISISEPEPVVAEVTSKGTICFGDANGSITIDTAYGGIGPYIFSLDGESFTTSNFFGGLTGGLYTAYVQDINGCMFTVQTLVEEPFELIVNAGSDVTVDLGDSTQIITQVNVFDPDSLNYSWMPPFGISCLACPDPWVRPIETTTFTVQVTDSLGCMAEDVITVTVDKSRDIYIPNVFTPNGDGINDNFMIFGGKGITSIDVLKIYDRWGELVFEAQNFQPNDPFFSWDGKLKGKMLNPSVFVYFAQVRFFDGVTIPYKGDVTLLK